MAKSVDFHKKLDAAFDRLEKLLQESDYGGYEVHYKNGWKIKAWITKKDLKKQRSRNI